MDGLRPVFNEGSQYLRHRYVSFPPFIDDGKLTTADFVRHSHHVDEILDRFFKFNPAHSLDICLGEAEFKLTMKNDLSLGSLTFGSSITSRPPLSDHWILHSIDPLSSHLDSRLKQNFQILAATWIIEQSVVENTLHGDNVSGLDYAQSVAGSKLLQCLEKTMSSSSLSKLHPGDLIALMTILVVTLSVVMSSRRRSHSSLVSLLC